jgi:hypothetical protein
MGFSEIFCLAGWLAIAFSKVLNPLSPPLSLSACVCVFLGVPNINVDVTGTIIPKFYTIIPKVYNRILEIIVAAS